MSAPSIDPTAGPERGTGSLFLVFKSGRLPSWYQLSSDERARFQQEHVDLMLDVAVRHGLRRIEGFRLLGAQEPWHYLWIIELPDLAAAEAWAQAEMEPPYGSHGFYEYHLARAWGPDYFPTWLPAGPDSPSRRTISIRT